MNNDKNVYANEVITLFFQYDKSDKNAEQYEMLQILMENWENEIVEFKEAKGGYDTDKVGKYFSAISNEANLRNKQCGWFILGVSEKDKKHIVGTSFKKGAKSLLEKYKYEISKNMTDGITFSEIFELYPIVDNVPYRVIMFKIPAAAVGMPTAWKNDYKARSGDSLVPLQQYKIDEIRSQERNDWSKQMVVDGTINDLDANAIKLAREKYKEKMGRPHISEEIDSISDEEFLTKIKLMRNGKITNAAMLLLGKEESDTLLEHAPIIMWRLYGKDDVPRDYAMYRIPFINVVDKVFNKIRNLTYRYMANQISLFPKETKQYDMWILRELLNNTIAHTNYRLGGRIYIDEFDEHITVKNPGTFLPHKVENVLKPGYNPPFYRNQLLAETMVNFNMIDTQSSGIKKVYRIQRSKFFPMPDYKFDTHNQVEVTVYGKILDEKYTFILFQNDDLDLETIFLLDQVQKGNDISTEAVTHLRKYHLVEGRKNNLYLSSDVSKAIGEKEQYVKNRGFDNKYYCDMIVEYLRKYGAASKNDIRILLLSKFPDVLSDAQKDRKILTLLTSLKNKGIIRTDSNNKQKSKWILVKLN